MMCNFRYIIGLFFLLSSHFVFSQAKIKTITLQETPLREIHIQYMYNYGLNMIMYQMPEYSRSSGFWKLVENPGELEGTVTFLPRSDSKVYINGILKDLRGHSLIHEKVPGEGGIVELSGIVDILDETPWNTQIPVEYLRETSEIINSHSIDYPDSLYLENSDMHSWVSFSGLYKKGDFYYFQVYWIYPYQECIDCPILTMMPSKSYFIFRYCPFEKLVIPVFMTPSIFNHEVCGLKGGLQDWFIELSKDYFCKDE